MSYRDNDEVREDEIDEEAKEAELDLDEAFEDDAAVDDDLLGGTESLEALYEEEDAIDAELLADEYKDGNY
jgi:hypothetical protein